MRLLKLDPWKREVTAKYYELETAVINFHVQSSDLMVFPLGQSHMLFLDEKWALRKDQAWFGMKDVPSGILGGYGVITGKDDEGGIANCGLNADAVKAQFTWQNDEYARRHPAVIQMRNDAGVTADSLLERTRVLIGLGGGSAN